MYGSVFDADDDARAEDVCDEVASLCDRLLGRPSSEESPLPYILTFEEDPAKSDANVIRPNMRVLILPKPFGNLN
ncbi:MAG: hypothetical protein M3072_10800 [Candidatus Dormibacteraeota bacterium]|nr:hypothetical protein [Candidatus Dormibacteraeota bacterium]